MAKENPHFNSLKTAYIFPIIEKKLAQLEKEHPNQRVINLGIGDVSLPLAPGVAEAICEATREMTQKPRGYGPCEGYPFLLEAIHKHEYETFGIELDEIFLSSGTNPDASSLHRIFDDASIVAVTDPSYPVYRDSSLLSGKKVVFLPTSEENGFVPQPPNEPVDIVYLCTPANPTGIALKKPDLEMWIDWAKKNGAILILDNVYNAFASSSDVPLSIYALDGAREVAIEMRSFSKSAGFTGLRCSYLVVPKSLQVKNLHTLWKKYHDICTNGIAYPIQKGALATFDPQVKQQLHEQVQTYKNAGKILCATLQEMGQTYFGGVDAPYIFWKVPDGKSSWEFFDQLLTESKILAIPGVGFGLCGEGYIRLSCFISETTATKASHALLHHFCPA